MRVCPDCLREFDDSAEVCSVDGAPLGPPRKLGRVIDGRYRIDALAGVGGTGAVYRAVDVVANRPVAVKLLRSDLADDAAARERFTREAGALASLAHPNVLSVLDFGVLPGEGAFLVTELLDGRTLEQELSRRGPLAVVEACRVVGEVARAVAAAHAAGVVHGDLALRNVILDARSGEAPAVKVLDFGAGRTDGAGERTDVAALGRMLYELLGGPVRGDAPVEAGFLAPWGPPEVEAVVLRAAASHTDDRVPSAAAFADALAAAVASPAPRSGRPPNNLPSPVTRFVGREHEIEAVERLLAVSRIVTLVGSGGIGKTRLALRVAERALDALPGGVWVAELASLADGALVAGGVAAALGVSDRGAGGPLEAAATLLRDEAALLILDNCEHLAAASGEVAAALVAECPRLTVLASSQEPLDVAGEAVFTVSALTDAEAVRLFVDRARLVSTGFVLDKRTGPAVARICRRLDNIPLAVELAVAKLHSLSLEEVLDRLDDRFELLTDGSRVTPARHHTLRATLDWSFEMLSVKERVMLERLSVFAGGCPPGALDAVCPGGMIGAGDVADLVGRLAERALVTVDADGARFRLLETIRQYAAERLKGSGERPAVLRRFVAWAVGLAERVEGELTGPSQAAWLARLEAEHDNLRAASRAASRELRDAEASLRLCGALERFLAIRGHLDEGRAWYDEALALPSSGLEPLRAKALYGAGALAAAQGDHAGAAAHFEANLAALRALGRRDAEPLTLNRLGDVAESVGDYERAEALYAEALAVSREVGDRLGVARSLFGLGLVAMDEDRLDTAAARFGESLEISREAGNEQGVATTLHNLGEVEFRRGNAARAEELLGRSFELTTSLGDRRTSAYTAIVRAGIAADRGAAPRAAAMLLEALELHAGIGDRGGVACAVEGLAGVLAGSDPEAALRLAGAAERLRAETASMRTPAERDAFERARATAEALASDPARAFDEGRRMSLAEALGAARRLARTAI